MKKSLLWIMVLVLSISMIAAFSLSGCKEEVAGEEEVAEEEEAAVEEEAVEEEPVEEIQLTFWNGFTGSDGVVLEEIVDNFNEEYAGNINIEMEIMAWDVMAEKLPPAISTGTAPSFVIAGPSDLPTYVDANSLQSVDDFWTVTGLSKDDFNAAAVDLGEYNGEYYGIPMQMFTLILYWNKDLFTAAGLDPETPPATWDKLYEYAEKMTDLSIDQYGYGIPYSPPAPEFFASLLWANGGDVVDLENRKSVLDSTENMESFAFLQDLAEYSPVGLPGPDLDNTVNVGKVGMIINGPWMINGFRENNIDFGAAAPPSGKVGQFTPANGNIFLIPSTTSEEEKLAVYEFLAYWNSHEIIKKWAMQSGFPPYLKSVIEDPDVIADPTLSVISGFGDLGRLFLPGIKEVSVITADVMWPLIETIVMGEGDLETVVKAASEDIDNILAGENE